MAVKIEWTEPVLEDLEAIFCYLEREWSEAIADKFIDLLKEKVKILSNQPYMGMASAKSPSVRSIKLSKHNRLYYKFDNDTLVLLNIFDTRQHPTKNTFR